MRYQTIGLDNRVVNATPFGRRLRRFLRKPEQKALLPEGGSWRSHGAWILADALVHWSGGRLRISCLRTHDCKVEHVIATEPKAPVFIDADGVGGQIDLMAKMAVIMHAPNVTVDPFEPEDAVRAGIPYDENTAIELAVRLLRRFGSYRLDLLRLTEQRTPECPRSSAPASMPGAHSERGRMSYLGLAAFG